MQIYDPGHMGDQNMDITGMGLGMWIFWIIIFLVLILVIKLLMSAANKQTLPSSETPIEILKRRYANGDIDEEEFDRRRKTLEQ